MGEVFFIDVTNRDGVQTARINLAKLQKTLLNVYLGQIGVHQSECGFPYLPNERNYLQANLELQEMGVMGDMKLSGWCRAIPRDVEAALPTGMKHFNISASTSDQMITHKYQGRRDRNRVIAEMEESVQIARGQAETLGVNAEDASRTDLDFLIQFARAAKEQGADRIRYCDTLGFDSPHSIYERVKTIAEKVVLPMELHCHDDLGMAVANSVSGAMGALDAGVDAYINTTVNGIGERAGQADLVSCILAFRFGSGMEKYPLGDPVDLAVATKLARYASYAFQIPIPINQTGVGANAFAHEAGIHADGALKNRYNYELFDFEFLGRDVVEPPPTGRVITTGEYGGLAGFLHVYEKLGMSFPDREQEARALKLVQLSNAHTQLPLSDDELRLIANHPDQIEKLLIVTP